MRNPIAESLGCLVWVIAIALFMLLIYHGDAIVNKLFGGC